MYIFSSTAQFHIILFLTDKVGDELKYQGEKPTVFNKNVPKIVDLQISACESN